MTPVERFWQKMEQSPRFWICSYCGLYLTGERSYTRDHVLPRVQGGKTTAENIVPSCQKCNVSKGQFTPLQWLMVRSGHDGGRSVGVILRAISKYRFRQSLFPKPFEMKQGKPKPQKVERKVKTVTFVARNGITHVRTIR